MMKKLKNISMAAMFLLSMTGAVFGAACVEPESGHLEREVASNADKLTVIATDLESCQMSLEQIMMLKEELDSLKSEQDVLSYQMKEIDERRELADHAKNKERKDGLKTYRGWFSDIARYTNQISHLGQKIDALSIKESDIRRDLAASKDVESGSLDAYQSLMSEREALLIRQQELEKEINDQSELQRQYLAELQKRDADIALLLEQKKAEELAKKEAAVKAAAEDAVAAEEAEQKKQAEKAARDKERKAAKRKKQKEKKQQREGQAAAENEAVSEACDAATQEQLQKQLQISNVIAKIEAANLSKETLVDGTFDIDAFLEMTADLIKLVNLSNVKTSNGLLQKFCDLLKMIEDDATELEGEELKYFDSESLYSVRDALVVKLEEVMAAIKAVSKKDAQKMDEYQALFEERSVLLSAKSDNQVDMIMSDDEDARREAVVGGIAIQRNLNVCNQNIDCVSKINDNYEFYFWLKELENMVV